jgi:16S rRNA (guanine527-N7)-methyltransferase
VTESSVPQPDWAALDAAWRPARAAGVLGDVSIENLRRHAAGYLPAAWPVLDPSTAGAEAGQGDVRSAVDLGTGAGVPGVLLATMLPGTRWLLVDANARRCEFARRAVRALDLSSRVEVCHARAEELAHDPSHRGVHDLVVARLFGPPADLAECALPLARPGGGRLVVSATSSTEAEWRRGAAAFDAGVDAWTTDDGDRFVAIGPTTRCPSSWPRRTNARRRSPIF